MSGGSRINLKNMKEEYQIAMDLYMAANALSSLRDAPDEDEGEAKNAHPTSKEIAGRKKSTPPTDYHHYTTRLTFENVTNKRSKKRRIPSDVPKTKQITVLQPPKKISKLLPRGFSGEMMIAPPPPVLLLPPHPIHSVPKPSTTTRNSKSRVGRRKTSQTKKTSPNSSEDKENINNSNKIVNDNTKSVPPQYTGCRYDVAKPPFSYASLIAQAMLAHPQRRLTLSQIYAWIMEKYPYYQSQNCGWQNSIRHNLSLNSCFVRLSFGPGDLGDHSMEASSLTTASANKGCYWTLKEDELVDFKDGEFKRRRLIGSGGIGRQRRRRGPSAYYEEEPEVMEPLPADTITPGSSRRTSIINVEVPQSMWEPPESPTSQVTSPKKTEALLDKEWERIQEEMRHRRVNDVRINGMAHGLRSDDVQRTSSPAISTPSNALQHYKTASSVSFQARLINQRLSLDMHCPELLESTMDYYQNQPNDDLKTDISIM